MPPYSAVVPRKASAPILQDFVAELCHCSKRQAKHLLDDKSVTVNGRRVWMARHPLKPGDRVDVLTAPAQKKVAPPAEDLPVLYRDDALLAVNKPAGRLSDRTADSVEALLRRQTGDNALRALHRLDRDTTGVLLFTSGATDRQPFVDLFRGNDIVKTYQVLVTGEVGDREFVIRKPLDGKSALTRVKVEKLRGGFGLLTCEIPTGRTHQIRRHLQTEGLRVLGDKQYSARDMPLTEVEKTLPHQLLHARSVAFTHPLTGRPVLIRAAFPAAFAETGKRLGLL